jgi:hypothetical protein
VLVDLSFPAAAARLANLARGGSLTRSSVKAAYGDGLTGLVRACPLAAAKPRRRLSRRATIR